MGGEVGDGGRAHKRRRLGAHAEQEQSNYSAMTEIPMKSICPLSCSATRTW